MPHKKHRSSAASEEVFGVAECVLDVEEEESGAWA